MTNATGCSVKGEDIVPQPSAGRKMAWGKSGKVQKVPMTKIE